MMPSKVRAPNNIAPAKLRLKLANECVDPLTKAKISSMNKNFKYNFLSSGQLDEQWKQKLMSLIETNMRSMYERSNWGWNYEEKLAEITKSTTRLVLVTLTAVEPENVASGLPQDKDKEPEDQSEFAGFMSYRFEVGANKNECALYVYEVHVVEQFQGQGLGKELMRMAKSLAIAFKMDKIMLTVFNYNIPALTFYKKLRFVPDKSTPSKSEVDYVILSHPIR